MNFLQEVAKLGAEQCAVALSTLLKVPVTVRAVRALQVTAPEVAVPDTASAAEVFVGVCVGIHGERTGSSLLLMSRADACRLVDAANRKPPETTTVLDDYGQSTILEIGNIMTGAFLAAIRKLVPVLLLHSIPHLVIDHWRQVLRSLPPGRDGRPMSLVECELVVETMNVRCFLVIVVDVEWETGAPRRDAGNRRAR